MMNLLAAFLTDCFNPVVLTVPVGAFFTFQDSFGRIAGYTAQNTVSFRKRAVSNFDGMNVVDVGNGGFVTVSDAQINEPSGNHRNSLLDTLLA